MDTNLGVPSSPPPVAGLGVAEEPYYQQYQLVASQARLTWTRPVWPFLDRYSIIASIDGVKQWDAIIVPSGGATDAAVVPALRPGELYSFSVAVRSTVATGAPVVIGLRPLGKSNPPSNVAGIAGFSTGGVVFLNWPEATDEDQVHIRYALRYSSTVGSWDTAASINKIASLNYQVAGVPLGTWRFWVKAIDSVGQESAIAAYIDLTVAAVGPFAQETVTLGIDEANSYNLTRHDYADRPDPTWLTDAGEVAAFGHVDPNNATGGWVDASITSGTLFCLPLYYDASLWASQIYDHGAVVVGNFAFSLPYRVLYGFANFSYQFSEDGITWDGSSSPIGIGKRFRFLYAIATTQVYIAPGSVLAVDGPATLQVIVPGDNARRLASQR